MFNVAHPYLKLHDQVIKHIMYYLRFRYKSIMYFIWFQSNTRHDHETESLQPCFNITRKKNVEY